MSFKRDGDDTSMLRNLQHRRVGDLLSNHIPDEEAKLLSNGRLTCLVCSRRPIFDTISILSIHRKGKKHLIELSKYLAAKRDLKQQKEKNHHEIMISTGSLPASDEKVLGNGFHLSAHASKYLSCAKRSNKERLQQRRHTLNFGRADNLIPTSDLTQREESTLSANADVRKYLKEIKKKRDLKKSIEECRSNYTLQPTRECRTTSPTKSRTEVDTHEQKLIPDASAISDSLKNQAETELKYKMSGWLKDSSGTWRKDPEAEFDSDEEKPDCH